MRGRTDGAGRLICRDACVTLETPAPCSMPVTWPMPDPVPADDELVLDVPRAPSRPDRPPLVRATLACQAACRSPIGAYRRRGVRRPSNGSRCSGWQVGDALADCRAYLGRAAIALDRSGRSISRRRVATIPRWVTRSSRDDRRARDRSATSTPRCCDERDRVARRCPGYRAARVLGLYELGGSGSDVQVARHWRCEVHVASRARRSRAGLGARREARRPATTSATGSRLLTRRSPSHPSARRASTRCVPSIAGHGGDRCHPPRPIAAELLWLGARSAASPT